MKKNYFKKQMIRLIVWIGYSIGLWRNISSTKKILRKRDLAMEYENLAKICQLTDLDREYLRISVSMRARTGIMLLIGSRIPTSRIEFLKEEVESYYKVDIIEREEGYRIEGIKDIPSYWFLSCPRNYKRLMELFAICLKLEEKR